MLFIVKSAKIKLYIFSWDSLTIYDGGSNTSPMLGNQYCGDSLPPSQISSSNQLFFHFHSDHSDTATGFKLEYNATSKNWINCPSFFCHFWSYVGQPHSHIGWATSMPLASFNPTNPRTNLWSFRKKILRIGDFKYLSFSEFAILIFFCFILIKISPNLYGSMDGLKFWCFPENSLLCIILRYMVYRCGNYAREETIEGQKLFPEIWYLISPFSSWLW